jgi:NAD(P)-dependent dehydrogenase (short-subunit alcohol dehydrogenase family)
VAVDRNNPASGSFARFVKGDLSNPASIHDVARTVGKGIDGLCNIAGLPPTRGRVPVIQVNFLGLREFTEAMLPNFNDGAAIVNLASLAGIGWPDAGAAIQALIALRDFDGVGALCDAHQVDDARSYFYSKLA